MFLQIYSTLFRLMGGVLMKPSLGRRPEIRPFLVYPIFRNQTNLPVIELVGHWYCEQCPGYIKIVVLRWLRNGHRGGDSELRCCYFNRSTGIPDRRW
jgi:hypothetical protein